MHGKSVCRCGIVIEQCKCMNHTKTVRVVNTPCVHTTALTGVVTPPSKPVRPEDQQLPVPNELPSMHDQAAQDLEKRKTLGAERYGVPLQPSNGRNAVRDAYEEALDGAAYGAQAMWEQDHPEATYVGELLRALITQDSELDFGPMYVPPAVVSQLEDNGFTVLKEN